MQKEIRLPYTYIGMLIGFFVPILLCLLAIEYIESTSKRYMLSICAIMFAYYLFRTIYRLLFNNKPLLVINQTGIYLYDDIGKETYINWTDIKRIRIEDKTIGQPRFLYIETNNKTHNLSDPTKMLSYITSFPESKNIVIEIEKPITKSDKFKIKYRYIFTEILLQLVMLLLLIILMKYFIDFKNLNFMKFYYFYILSCILYFPIHNYFYPPAFFIENKLHFKYYFYSFSILIAIAFSVRSFHLSNAYHILLSIIVTAAVWSLLMHYLETKFPSMLGIKDCNPENKL